MFKLQGKEYRKSNNCCPAKWVSKVDDIVFDVVPHDLHDEDRIHMVPLGFSATDAGWLWNPNAVATNSASSEVLHVVHWKGAL